MPVRNDPTLLNMINAIREILDKEPLVQFGVRKNKTEEERFSTSFDVTDTPFGGTSRTPKKGSVDSGGVRRPSRFEWHPERVGDTRMRRDSARRWGRVEA